jgi:hypothetical protein
VSPQGLWVSAREAPGHPRRRGARRHRRWVTSGEQTRVNFSIAPKGLGEVGVDGGGVEALVPPGSLEDPPRPEQACSTAGATLRLRRVAAEFNKRMKLTGPEPIEVRQLIRSVRPT